MLEALGPDARGLGAAAVLALLPGVLVVRSPWRAMPMVSCAFWVLAWTWAGGGSRLRLLHLALLAFVVLGAFRVLRPHPLPRPSPAHLALVLAAVVLAAPYAIQAAPAGSRLPLEALGAELLAWHDGWPASFEPLAPVSPFRASGLSMLGADVVLLSGAEPHRAVFAAATLGEVLLLLALWSLAEADTTPGRATLLAAVVVLATAPWSYGPGPLAAAFVAEALALWRARRGTPSAFAAGAGLAAAIAADAATALAGFVLAAIAVALSEPRDRAEDVPGRARVALLTALVLGLPMAWRPPPFAAPSLGPLAALAVTMAAGALAATTARRVATPDRMVRYGVLALLAAAGLGLWREAADEARPRANEIAAMRFLREHARPLDRVCAADVPAARWVPAVAARPTDVALSDGWPPSAGSCRAWLALRGRLPRDAPSGAPAFTSGDARAWTTSQPR
jgi:hypothetical protein